ncbi:hypothetical protein JHK82_033670 [Glycine max]|nr:hypothetical protein JHK85_034388 [Glycine max]KAG5119250.1 hypothetical protein JHK82_033670 [Glycine max]KAG5140242.1 hypothetical protein JHK84_034010 [Glycine max]
MEIGRSILECWVRQKRFNQASKNSATTDIPSPLKDLSVHISSFSNKGFNTKEMVALSVKLSKHYGDINLSPLGVTTSVLFDTAYFKNLINKKGLLHSDQQLFSGGSTDSRVTAYSNDPSAFYADFASAMVKMGNLSSLTRKSGQIRSNCHKRQTCNDVVVRTQRHGGQRESGNKGVRVRESEGFKVSLRELCARV